PRDARSGKTGGVPTLHDLEVQDLHRLDVRLIGPGAARTITLRPRKPWNTKAEEAFRRSGDATFSLAGLYSVGGLYRDTNRDLVPDETAAYLSLRGTAAAPSVVDLAARIGLETAGIRLPLFRVASQENDPAEGGFPILLGTDHYQIQRLVEEGKIVGADERPEGGRFPAPGKGIVELVDRAFGDRSAMVVSGGDAEGFQAVTNWLARRAPYLWIHGKGEYRLADAETEVRRFLQAREAPGQVALALTKLGAWMDRLAEGPSQAGGTDAPFDPVSGSGAGRAPAGPVRIEVELAAAEAPPGLDRVVASVVRDRFPDAELDVQTWPTGFGVGDTIFAYDWEVPWEVDDARRILEAEVYPAIRPDSPVEVELRVSESPEIRASLEAEIRGELAERGVPEATVRVLSAYKQGFSWIHDVLLPQLRNLDVASIQLSYHTLEESEEVRWQTIAAETRWLQEVYPFDAVLARELGIPDSVITFHPTRQKDPIYTFEARDSAGAVILRDTFTPKYVVRPFFDLFPEYEQVRVTTGWIRAKAGERTFVDERIVTDPERFWDRLQTEAYGEIIRYVMDSQDGAPSPANAPFFDAFQVDLRLSEPDYRIGIDEEGISSLEALHEDIFFETHTLFSLLGGRYQTDLPFPGRVLPYLDPGGEGQPGKARLVFTGKERGNPELVVRSWVGEGSEPVRKRYELDPLTVEGPRIVGATVASGEEGLSRLLARVAVADSVDRTGELEGRSSEGAIDRQFISAELLEGMVNALGRLHEAGFFQDALSWDRVEELALDFRMEKDSTFQRSAALTRSRHPRSTSNPRLVAEGWRYQGEPLVQWETPIPPEENEEILGRLGTFPGVYVYYLTDSYLGHRVWAADFLPPQEAEFISQAKLNALKPTLFISGREHANEVSSTSHILRLGELLVTDSANMGLLRKVNVVLHPMTNPDGATLAYQRWVVNPNHMLHAGRPGRSGWTPPAGGRVRTPSIRKPEPGTSSG
ncbi:MAG: M14 family zinc carboxypeptidase, partial [Longimicrobiales bacterium]